MLDPIPIGHHHRHQLHVTDPQKPNLIFSSNIPFRVASCVAEKHLFLGGTTSRLVDLAQSVGEIEVVIELNALLQRNCQLTPFEMVRRNLVFVAKNKSTVQPGAGIGSGNIDTSGFTGVWKTVFSMKSASEVFVASFHLRLQSLTIDLANPSDVTIEFCNDDSYSLILLCDSSVATDIESYIRLRLLAELRNNTDISMDISNSNTILQELPVNELSALIRVMQGDGLGTLDAANVIDTTLDSIESSVFLQKQLVFDDEDYDPSGDEIKVLHSDDSGKCTANEDEYEPRAFTGLTSDSNGQISLEEQDINSVLHGTPDLPTRETTTRQNGKNSSDKFLKAPFEILDSTTPANESQVNGTLQFPDNNEKFVSNLQNLRHNDLDEVLNGGLLPQTDICGSISELSFEVEEINIDDYAPESMTEAALEPCTPSRSAPNILNESSPIDSIFSPPQTHNRRENAFSSPQRPGQVVSRQQSTPEFQLRKKLSYAMISSDDNSGLEFAFRDNSEGVPSFIKEDKKFKFIKVGKVQKFVHLFEEQKDSVSSATSRNNTRPGSPLKRTANQ